MKRRLKPTKKCYPFSNFRSFFGWKAEKFPQLRTKNFPFPQRIERLPTSFSTSHKQWENICLWSFLRPLSFCLTWIESRWTLCSDKNKSLKGRTMWYVKKTGINYVDNINLDNLQPIYHSLLLKIHLVLFLFYAYALQASLSVTETIFNILYLFFCFQCFRLFVWFWYIYFL